LRAACYGKKRGGSSGFYGPISYRTH